MSAAGDTLIFLLVLVRMPRADVPLRAGIRGAVLAAVGFELLKIVGTYTIAASAHSPTAGPFAGILAVLVWVQLVSRWVLFCVAWTAEASQEGAPEQPDGERPPHEQPDGGAARTAGGAARTAGTGAPALSPVALGAGLVGAGAVAGAAAAWAVRARGERHDTAR